eukprot:CFRG4003T1
MRASQLLVLASCYGLSMARWDLSKKTITAIEKSQMKNQNSIENSTADVASENLNIHIKLSEECSNRSTIYNGLATDILKENQTVDFVSGLDQPHISLYLTNFQESKIPELTEVINNMVWAEDCVVNLDHANNSGTGYAFWVPDVWQPPCLRSMADYVLNATNEFIITPVEANLPTWIQSLPEPEKTQLTENYYSYGSPNVGDYFKPHVTYAAVEYGVVGNFDAVADVVGTSQGSAVCTYIVAEIAVGMTGTSGTVLTGEDIASTTKVGASYSIESQTIEQDESNHVLRMRDNAKTTAIIGAGF